VAAMLPPEWQLKLGGPERGTVTDEDLRWPDYRVAGRHDFRIPCATWRMAALGQTVIAGGPLFTTGHERLPGDSALCSGEAEE